MKKRSSMKGLFDSKDNTPVVRWLARGLGIGLAALLIGALVITYGPIQTIAIWTVVFVCIVIAWFAILFTGRYPRELFDFVVGVGRWALRVGAYAFLMTTDRYPPFSLQP